MIKIIYEDNHILAVEKPPNMLSQGDETRDADILTLLKEDLKKRYNKQGNVFLGLVHRLDRPVGGAMVFGRTSKAASRLSEQIRNGSFHKTYYAVVMGMPAKSPCTLEHYLEKDESRNIVSVVPESSGRGKKASLSYEVVEVAGADNGTVTMAGDKQGMSLVKINLHTGRSHQIRVQFAAIGHPLFGDQKYGDHKYGEQQFSDSKYVNQSQNRQLALWSAGIVCTHPTRKEQMEFLSTPPDSYPWSIFRYIKDL